MNAKQVNELTSHHATIAVLVSHPEVTGSPVVQATIDELVQRLENVDRLVHIQKKSVPIKTVVRKETFAAAYAAAVVIGGRALNHAHKRGLRELADSVNLRAIPLRRLRLLERLVALQSLHDAVVPVLPDLAEQEVDAAMLADLQVKIDRATSALDETRVGMVTRKAATDTLRLELEALKRFFVDRLDPLIGALAASYPEFYREYRGARQVIRRPGQPLGISVPPGASTTAAPAPATQNVNPLAA